jgi:hypothetical protein
MDRRLLDSNLRKSPEGLVEARKHLSTLRQAWFDMLHGNTLAPAPEAEMAAA